MRSLLIAGLALALAGCTDTSETTVDPAPSNPDVLVAEPDTAFAGGGASEDDLYRVASDWTCDENARFDSISLGVMESANEYTAYVQLGPDGNLSVVDTGTWEFTGRALTLTSNAGDVTRYEPADVTDETMRLTRADNGLVVTCTVVPMSP